MTRQQRTVIEAQVSGVCHVDDVQVTGAAFSSTFVDLLDVPEPNQIPAWLARFSAGKITAERFTNQCQRVGEVRTRPEVEVSDAYCDGPKQVISTWHADGTLTELWEELTAEPATQLREDGENHIYQAD